VPAPAAGASIDAPFAGFGARVWRKNGLVGISSAAGDGTGVSLLAGFGARTGSGDGPLTAEVDSAAGAGVLPSAGVAGDTTPAASEAAPPSMPACSLHQAQCSDHLESLFQKAYCIASIDRDM
jgi:hypothetical protein